MINGVVIKDLKQFSDDRGWLSEIYRQDEIDFSPVMSYVSLTRSGTARGPHEHVYQSDFFVFLGPGTFELHLWDRRKDSSTYQKYEKITAGVDEPKSVLVPPGVVHGYKCVSKEDGLSINLPDKLYKGIGKQEEVDEIRWEEDPDSPYKI